MTGKPTIKILTCNNRHRFIPFILSILITFLIRIQSKTFFAPLNILPLIRTLPNYELFKVTCNDPQKVTEVR